MPKGQFGCWSCGAPTAFTLQAWLRSADGYLESGNSRERTVASVARSFCADCAAAFWFVAEVTATRRADTYHGCGYCGYGVRGTGPSALRIQVWLRNFPDCSSVRARTLSLCEPCGRAAYAKLWTMLDGGGQHPTGTVRDGTSLAAARARR